MTEYYLVGEERNRSIIVVGPFIADQARDASAVLWEHSATAIATLDDDAMWDYVEATCGGKGYAIEHYDRGVRVTHMSRKRS